MIYISIILVGILLGAFINWGIYSWAWFARPISPWCRQHGSATTRRWSDRIPIFGWIALRRECELYGRWFWVRPMMIELAFGPMLAGLYWWEVVQLGLIDMTARPAIPAMAIPVIDQWMVTLFLTHGLMFTLLMIATFIDFDEQTIPDAITIPGTLLALIAHVLGTGSLAEMPVGSAACLPWTMGDSMVPVPVLFSSPQGLGQAWAGSEGLGLALGIFGLWCFALSNRRWIMRHGFRKAIQYFAAGLVRYDTQLCGRWKIKIWKLLALVWIVGSAAIVLVFWQGSARVWLALLSALVGLGVGGGQIWAVRIAARIGLGREAMGFGDVTLMAMVGAFLGWQAAVFTFFLAPMTAIPIVLVTWVLTGNRMLPFGPYLAAAAVLTVVCWDRIWNQWGALTFSVGGPMIASVLATALVLMCALLALMRMLQNARAA